ncbi:LemA family protein [Bosea sp. 685]|uniref:LemA family protein n=1 Tax=Bosea sp. 685 TaxID=3080057 RepID=UPI002892A558|nr:LemA family protein [Bosea sp. 685]WNJ93397.1 LemA family protein [Bosea sp. 685]
MWIVLGVAALVLLWGVFAFNRLVRLRMQVRAAWAQIDVQLRRRHDLIPNLVESVKSYMAHERSVLDAVVAARGQAQSAGDDVAVRAAAEGRLGGALSRMMSLAEAYPQLKASDNVQLLQEDLASSENRIAFARQHFNDCVMSYNTAIGSLPDMLFAGRLGFAPQAMFETDEASRAPVAVRL